MKRRKAATDALPTLIPAMTPVERGGDLSSASSLFARVSCATGDKVLLAWEAIAVDNVPQENAVGVAEVEDACEEAGGEEDEDI